MVKAASLFSQLLHHFPRTEFQCLVSWHRAEYRAKGFDCWTQFVAMLFCHLARADSLREICNGLACCLGKLKHLGISKGPNKSTLSYANGHRPAELYGSFSGRFWQGSVPLGTWELAHTSFAFATNFSALTPPPFRFAWDCSPGPNFEGPREE